MLEGIGEFVNSFVKNPGVSFVITVILCTAIIMVAIVALGIVLVAIMMFVKGKKNKNDFPNLDKASVVVGMLPKQPKDEYQRAYANIVADKIYLGETFILATKDLEVLETGIRIESIDNGGLKSRFVEFANKGEQVTLGLFIPSGTDYTEVANNGFYLIK